MKIPEKYVHATEIKNLFGDYLKMVLDDQKPLLIKRHGRPAAVLVSLKEWGELARTASLNFEQMETSLKDLESLVEHMKSTVKAGKKIVSVNRSHIRKQLSK